MEKASLVIVNKNDRNLSDTLQAMKPFLGQLLGEILVVDASRGALDDIRLSHEWARWIDYEQPKGARTTIAQQRNVGVRNAKFDIIAFTDSGCLPEDGWIDRLLEPILESEESVTCGPVKSVGKSVYARIQGWGDDSDDYVSAAATINLAFRRRAFEAVNGFDETFGAGEDIDFTWRLTDCGYRLRWVSDAVVQHDWGTPGRQLRRAFFYGRGACRLFRKHPQRIRRSLSENPVPFVYSIFLLGIPFTLKWKWYPLLLVWPLWRHRKAELRSFVVLNHLVMGAGVLYEMVRPNT